MVILDSLQDARGGYIDKLTFLKTLFSTPFPLQIPVEPSEYQPLFLSRQTIAPLANTLAAQEDTIDDKEVYTAYIEFVELLTGIADNNIDLVGFCG